MKKHDIQPTDENIRETFRNDSIGRNNDLVNFIKIIDSIEESYSIALDSYWGSGKTFFVKQVKMVLDAVTEESYGEVKGETSILSKWVQISSNYKLKKHVPIYYDAWQNDCDDDPIYSLVYQMTLDTENIKGLKDKINFSDVLNTAGKITGIVAGKLSEHLAGVNPNEIVGDLKKNDFLETLRERKDISKRIEEYIDKLLPKGCDRLLIIIDELDRCNPEFAVKLLERIKHYFNNDRVTFLFSVNLVELQHTIKKHYGSDFNASRYLDRFFDLHVTLPPADMNKFLESQGLYSNNSVFDNSMNLVIKKYNLQLREITRYIDISRKIVADYVYEKQDYNTNCQNVIMQLIVPIVVALKITNLEKYSDFVSGRDSSPLLDFYNDGESIKNVRYHLSFFYNDDFYLLSLTNIMLEIDSIHDILNKFYDGLFKKGNVDIGKCTITDSERKYFHKIISLLSENTMKSIKSEESITSEQTV